MGDFKLSASLEGHSDDVRAVAFPDPKVVLSASRDATVRIWRQLSSPPPNFDYSISSHGTAFINSVAYLPPTDGFPEGLILSGGQEPIVEARQPGRTAEDNAEALLLGHSHNVCAIDVNAKEGYVVTGSWDQSGRVWRVGKWEGDVVLEGHKGAVWAVLAFDRDTIVTGCADQLIRVFNTSGRLLRTIKGNKEVVRALCKVPYGHPSGAQFASASNDGIIRLWTLDGSQVGELHGHESFIYSLASLPSGELVSAGEDRTVRIWKGSACIQTITHPAISVWAVAACAETGDIVTGASDRVVRVFTRSKDREADPEAVKHFEDSVKSSSIPQQSVGSEINKEKLPGPEFLKQKSGTKEGQVQMIREDDGSVSAHQWSQGTQQWTSIGTVVDAVGSSGKKTEYLGQDYDYVFDVDIEDGKPPLKLPYNLSQNPYEAATKFIQDNELPVGYLDQTANFIIQNTQGATIGQNQNQSQHPGADPYGQESRYRPGDGASSTPSQPPPTLPASRPKVLPQTEYLSIKSANLKTIQKKIEELNQQLIESGHKDLSLNPTDLQTLQSFTSQLGESAPLKASPIVESGISLVLKIALTWPSANRLPGLDLLRIAAASTDLVAQYNEGGDLLTLVADSGVFDDKDRTNNMMLAIRLFANLFETKAGQALVMKDTDQILSLVQSAPTSAGPGPANRNLTIAITTFYINFAVLLTSADLKSEPSSSDRALSLLEELANIANAEKDSEAVYRSLVAIGTLLTLGDVVCTAAKEVFDVPKVLDKVEKGIKEPRIKGVVSEIREALK